MSDESDWAAEMWELIQNGSISYPDHEQWLVKCDECNGLGEVYDGVPCAKCDGDGKAEEEARPVELEDIERDWIWPVCSYCGKPDDGTPRGCAVGGCPLGLDC